MHLLGLAADLRVTGLSSWTTAQIIAQAMAAEKLKLGQLILKAAGGIGAAAICFVVKRAR